MRGKKTSYMREHLKLAHPTINFRDRKALLSCFEMSVISTARTPLARQLGEVLAIRRAGSKGDCVLNSKDEYTRCYVPLLTVEGGRSDVKVSKTLGKHSVPS